VAAAAVAAAAAAAAAGVGSQYFGWERLLAAGYKLLAIGCWLLAAGLKLQAAFSSRSRDFACFALIRVQSFRFQVPGFGFKVPRSLALSTAHRRLPTAYRRV